MGSEVGCCSLELGIGLLMVGSLTKVVLQSSKLEIDSRHMELQLSTITAFES